MVSLAEEIGFSTAWFAEHHFTNYSISVSPFLMAAHMAGYSRRIRLGTAVVVLPLYEPMRLAQEIALLLSHWDFIERTLTDGHAAAASWQGEQVETDFLLTPLQSPLPPLYLTTTQPQVLKRFAHLGVTLFMTAGWRG
ncbi:LLM class flavin-dependent oxidoreductase [Sodalis glossinidius]|uniref:LLM class flavin-dependent oxidoreductase n=1 Tax=Sodalis glossinidius TaxID=63612 RepID=UPI000314498A